MDSSSPTSENHTEPAAREGRESVWIKRALLTIAAAHAPLLWEYGRQLWRQEHYQFFPFALAAFAYFYWTRRDRQQDSANESIQLGRRLLARSLWVAGDLVLLFTAVSIHSPWLAAVSAFWLAFAVCRATKERDRNGTLTYLVLLLALIVRLPLRWDLWLTGKLQVLTTRLASGWLHQAGYLHFRAGNILEFPNRTLLVEDACSGMHSIFAVMFLAAVLSVWLRRSWLHSLVLLCVAAFWAVAGNIVRIILIAALWESYGLDFAVGWRHDLLGHVILVASMLLLCSMDQMLRFFSGPLPWVRYEAYMHVNPLIAAWNRGGPGDDIVSNSFLASRDEDASLQIQFWRLGAALGGWFRPAADSQTRTRDQAVPFVLLTCLAAAAILAMQASRALLPDRESKAAVGSRLAADLPRQLGGLRILDFSTEIDEQRGLQRATWTFQWGHRAATAVCDYPFHGWHSLLVCYRRNGWVVEQERVTPVMDDFGKPPWQCVEARLRKPSGDYGYVVFSLFDEHDHPIAPPEGQAPDAPIWERLRRGGWLPDTTDVESVQVQVFVESPTPLDHQQERELVDIHRRVRDALRAEFFAASEPPRPTSPLFPVKAESDAD